MKRDSFLDNAAINKAHAQPVPLISGECSAEKIAFLTA